MINPPFDFSALWQERQESLNTDMAFLVKSDADSAASPEITPQHNKKPSTHQNPTANLECLGSTERWIPSAHTTNAPDPRGIPA
jgi:hypothetical protein